LFFQELGELVLQSGWKNKTVPAKPGQGFLGKKEGYKITEGNLVVPTIFIFIL
jgi:hypothetical protein